MSLFKAAEQPKTNLGRYRLLSPTAGVHVSPLQLRAMSIGDKWAQYGMGSMDKEASFKLLDAYYDNGVRTKAPKNSLANGWKRETFEINSSLRQSNFKNNKPERQQIMYVGNNAKSLHLSLEASLKKLRTTYIDLLYVHWWDWETSIEEVMKALHQVVAQGKVIYLGISDTPAWVVSRVNQYARDHALTPFVVYQGAWSILDRSFEREIIPMAKAENMALAPWNVLAAGKIRTDEEEERRRQTGENGRTIFVPDWERTDREKLVCKALEKVAQDIGAKHITAVAIAYLMQKTPYVFPIVGGRKVEHLMANIEALELVLSDEQIKYLENALPFDPGFPVTFIGDGTTTSRFFARAGQVDPRPQLAPIRPADK